MRPTILRAVLTGGFCSLFLATAGLSAGPAAAQSTPPAAAPAPGGAPGAPVLKQIPLTAEMIDRFLAAKKDVDTIVDALPEGAADQPAPAVIAKLDAAAKKHGFAGYAEYDDVSNNISLVMAGIDPDTKAYVGPEAVIRKEIAQVQADKSMSPKDKKQTLEELQGALKNVTPLQFPASIEVVTKNYVRLNEAMPEE